MIETDNFAEALKRLKFSSTGKKVPQKFHKLSKKLVKKQEILQLIQQENIKKLENEIKAYEKEIDKLKAANAQMNKNIIANSRMYAFFVTQPSFKELTYSCIEAERTKNILDYYQRVSDMLKKELDEKVKINKPVKEKEDESYQIAIQNYFQAFEENYKAKCELEELTLANEAKAFALINEIETIRFASSRLGLKCNHFDPKEALSIILE